MTKRKPLKWGFERKSRIYASGTGEIPAKLKPLTPILDEINGSITRANTKIDEHNTVVNSQLSQQKHCIQQVWERIAFDLADTLNDYRAQKSILESEIETLDKESASAFDSIERLERDIEMLTKQTVNTAQTMQTINKLLHDSGFEGFKLREKPNTPNVYEVIRPNGDIAERLSEGERNFIAFQYFYFQI